MSVVQKIVNLWNSLSYTRLESKKNSKCCKYEIQITINTQKDRVNDSGQRPWIRIGKMMKQGRRRSGKCRRNVRDRMETRSHSSTMRSEVGIS